MDCLFDYIGLAGCGGTAPASGLFINSLPGISLKSIDSLADADQVNYLGVWKDVQTRAIKRLELMIISEMAKNTALKGVKFQTSTHIPRSTTPVTINGMYILLKTNCNSTFQYHYINNLCIDDLFASNDYDIHVYDYDTMELLDEIQYSIPFSSSADCIEIPVNKKYYRQNILIRLEKSNGQWLFTPASTISTDCVSIEWGQYISSGNIYSSNANCFGVNLHGYAVGCDANNLACDNKSLFATTLWYLEGSELMMERIASNRVNFWTMDRKQAEELKAFFDVEAEKNLKMAMNGVSFADCDCCTKCDPLVAIREARL